MSKKSKKKNKKKCCGQCGCDEVINKHEILPNGLGAEMYEADLQFSKLNVELQEINLIQNRVSLARELIEFKGANGDTFYTEEYIKEKILKL